VAAAKVTASPSPGRRTCVRRFSGPGQRSNVGLTPSGLRQDRILDEARHTADPVDLMRVFGISDATAMKYVYAAHPERRSTVPR
jgi:hypothetical protein